MQSSQAESGQLEAHLRNLILTNSDRADQAATPLQPPATFTLGKTKPQFQGPRQTSSQPPSATHTATPTTPKASKRRPNQAQRRQMQAQLSIPVDTRAPPSQDAKSHAHSHQYGGPPTARRNSERNSYRPNPGTQYGGFESPPGVRNNYPFSYQRHHPNAPGQAPIHPSNPQSFQRHPQQHNNYDTFSKGVNVVSADAFRQRTRLPSQPPLYIPGGQHQFALSPEQIANQSALLDRLCHNIIMNAEIERSEIAEKENFRAYVEAVCRDVISKQEIEVDGITGFQPHTVQLKCFGSLASGFATKAADMDLGLLSPMSRLSPSSLDSPIPRLVEKALLEHGFGARLLTRTRVPIIKLCEKPDGTLHQALSEARARWEKGLTDDGHEAMEDDIDDRDDAEHGAAVAVAEASHSKLDTEKQSPQKAVNESKKLDGEQITSLRQAASQSLSSYYGNAKALLRLSGGRDVTISNAASLTAADYNILDNTSSAFINGLHDEILKSRVQSYPSLRPGMVPNFPNIRSLSGTFMIIEGEKFVMLWEAQTATASHSKLVQNAHFVQAWKDLHTRRTFGTEPLLFNREVHVALEKLRQVPLIQLLQLRQESHEPAAQYYARAVAIRDSLSHRISSLDPALISQLVENYISGICGRQEREAVKDFASHAENKTLDMVARKHKLLHLAADYRRAIEKSLYSSEHIPIIEEYIKILQDDSLHAVVASDSTAAPTEGTVALVEKVRHLPDPSKLAPNQPRDRYHDKLEFPKTGVGVQCDINFSAHLALQNTLLLRCYSSTDARVRPMVLFVKHWAKVRGINTPYRGTLSSYGYVLMVLHYLVNVATPFVCPNLQHLAPQYPNLPPEALEGIATCQGRDVRFWRDEAEIQRLASMGQITQNQESVGSLLRGFFEYYAQNNVMSTTQKRTFDWGREVLSLRTHGGLLLKQEKGWTGAKTVLEYEAGPPPNPAEASVNTPTSPTDNNFTHQMPAQGQPGSVTSPGGVTTISAGQPTQQPREMKEVRYRFLFAIEDPFELDHNVARTVTHNGIVSIRDEFRRAWRILRYAGKHGEPAEDLLEDAKLAQERLEKRQFDELLKEIHGPEIFSGPVSS
ncbi:hypothetical protein GGR52DRAFT_362584 [Hypoxylon sp. FL1284]|nr:hypothetical protein GGR52DRAFT_362584 [Hypoxylon sp. FL1284]